jgi:hypothetical protein
MIDRARGIVSASRSGIDKTIAARYVRAHGEIDRRASEERDLLEDRDDLADALDLLKRAL